MLTPNDKIQIISNPTALPGTCVLCHGPGDGRKFLDFGLDIDFYGQVLFCDRCLTPVAEALNYVPFDEYKKCADILQEALDRGIALENDNNRLRSLLDGLVGHSSSDTPLPVSTIEVPQPQLPTESDVVADDGSRGKSEPKRTSKSIAIGGPENLSDSSDGDDSGTINIGGIDL